MSENAAGAVPRIFHWWWDGPALPPEYTRFRDRWRELHPQWDLEIWDQARFLARFEHHPATALYRDRERWSPHAHEWGWKTNIARYVILQGLGGVWVDADLEPLRPIDPLIEQLEASPASALAAYEDRTHVNNAFLASAPGGAFITVVTAGLARRVQATRKKPSNIMTGPHYLTEMVAQHPDSVKVLDRALVYPMHWSELDRRDEQFPAAYTLHHWHRKTTEIQQRRAGRRPRPSTTNRKPSMVHVPPRIRKLPGLTPEEVALTLADLAAQVPPERAIVELGVYQGRTLLYLAWGARQGQGAHVWGIDPWDLPGKRVPYAGKVRKAYTDPGVRAWARYNVKALGYSNQITLKRAFSTEVGARWNGPPVGLLYVDGDHRYDAVCADVRAWTPHLADDAMIAFDDHDDGHPEVVQAVADMVAEGILHPVQMFHDRLAVTRLGGGNPELIHREQMETEVWDAVNSGPAQTDRYRDVAYVHTQDHTADDAGGWTQGPSEINYDEAVPGTKWKDVQHDPALPSTLPDAVAHSEPADDAAIPEGGAIFPLPEAQDMVREHPGTGQPMTDQEDQLVDCAAIVLPGEVRGVTEQTTLDKLNAGQLRALAQARNVEVHGDKRVRDNLISALRGAK